MKKIEKQTVGLISLKAKIKGFELVSKAISSEALKVNGDRKSLIKLKKRQLGVETRHYLAAYALIRSFPFSGVEKKCRKGNDVNASKILKIIEEHAPYKQFFNSEKNRSLYRRWTLEDVQHCLNRDEVKSS